MAGTKGVELVAATMDDDAELELDRPDGRPDPHVARGAREGARRSASSRPERVRPWTYEFDPAGLELLRRAIEHVAADAPRPRRSPAGA